jgi:aspartyl/asparaginyl beta-hydroxylase (cupin superfamily)
LVQDIAMKNFQRISQGLPVQAALNSVVRQPHLWDQNPARTHMVGTAHSDSSDIWLRFNNVTGLDPDSPEDRKRVMEDINCVNYPAMFILPQIRALTMGLMPLVEGEQLGRVIISRLPAGKVVKPHADEGRYSEYYDRFHLVLCSAPGCLFHCGDETVHMATGELWWFDNNIIHEVTNNSAGDRIHLIIDIRTFK